MRAPVLAATLCAGLLGACDVQFEDSSRSTETVTYAGRDAKGALGQDQHARVCELATQHMTGKPAAPVSWRKLDQDTVRLAFGPDQVAGAEVVECDFSGDKLTWRTVDGTRPAQFSPETLKYEAQGDTVSVTQPNQRSFKARLGGQPAEGE